MRRLRHRTARRLGVLCAPVLFAVGCSRGGSPSSDSPFQHDLDAAEVPTSQPELHAVTPDACAGVGAPHGADPVQLRERGLEAELRGDARAATTSYCEFLALTPNAPGSDD